MLVSQLQMSNSNLDQFYHFILSWYHQYGRHHLPWRQHYQPYQVWVSEIMLQQTQVDRVQPKFTQFLNIFPTLDALASATPAEVVVAWQGLGYNRRALNLLKGAQFVQAHLGGEIPEATQDLLNIPGIGPYTASAIQAFAFNQPAVVIETNIRTVLIYHFFAGQNQVSDQDLSKLLQNIQLHQPRVFYSGMMDYGAYLKKVFPNPSRRSKHHTKQSSFKGSLRQVRGSILKILSSNKRKSLNHLKIEVDGNTRHFESALTQLRQEGFITVQNNEVSLKP